MRSTGWISLSCAVATGIFWLLSTVFNWWTNGIINGLTTLLPVPVAFACGLTTPTYGGLGACVAMVAVGESTGFNPFVVVIVLGPWFAGAVVQERQKVTRQLAKVGRELEAESHLLAEEAVRVERARIARELHDIVAHCVSVMVIQAYAGEKLMATDQASASDAFDHIARAATQAQHEITHLVDLLETTTETPFAGTLSNALTELATSASTTGLEVRLHLAGQPDQIPISTAAVVYRVVQEGVTNALKHSSGAPITIMVDVSDDITVDVLNGRGQLLPAHLGSTGGGHGLAGLRERVAGLGGDFTAGPEPGDAWRVCVRLPGPLEGHPPSTS